LISSKPVTVVVRGGYSYGMHFSNTEDGVVAVVYSKAGQEINQDDEFIFVDANNKRKSYRFIDMGEVEKEGSVPVYMNTLQLDLPAIDWFSSTNITAIYLRNNISLQMRKLSIPQNRQGELRSNVSCFEKQLDRSMVKNTILANTEFKIGRNSSASGSGSSAGGGRRVTDISLLNDEELAGLKQELVETKSRLRAEIQEEKDKANKIKAALQDEVNQARENAAEQKAKYAEEVLAARKASQDEIESSKATLAVKVSESKKNADEAMEKISNNEQRQTKLFRMHKSNLPKLFLRLVIKQQRKLRL